jgi:hypothetical protein
MLKRLIRLLGNIFYPLYKSQENELEDISNYISIDPIEDRFRELEREFTSRKPETYRGDINREPLKKIDKDNV